MYGVLIPIRFFFFCCFGLKVLLTTPTTPTERMKAIVEAAEGFVYLVSLWLLVNILVSKLKLYRRSLKSVFIVLNCR